MPTLLILLIIQGVVVGLFCSYIANAKGRSGLNWFVLGFLFSILALLALIAVPKLEGERTAASGASPSDSTVVPKHLKAGYEGTQDISLPAYQLFLTRRFSIERDPTLGVYVIQDQVFATLEDALREAEHQWRTDVAVSEAVAAKARKDAAARDRAVAEAREADANRARKREKEVRRLFAIAAPVAVVLLGALWMIGPRVQAYVEKEAKIREAEAPALKCLILPSEQAARCLKAFRADQACSKLSGTDSIKCISDFMDG